MTFSVIMPEIVGFLQGRIEPQGQLRIFLIQRICGQTTGIFLPEIPDACHHAAIFSGQCHNAWCPCTLLCADAAARSMGRFEDSIMPVAALHQMILTPDGNILRSLFHIP